MSASRCRRGRLRPRRSARRSACRPSACTGIGPSNEAASARPASASSWRAQSAAASSRRPASPTRAARELPAQIRGQACPRPRAPQPDAAGSRASGRAGGRVSLTCRPAAPPKARVIDPAPDRDQADTSATAGVDDPLDTLALRPCARRRAPAPPGSIAASAAARSSLGPPAQEVVGLRAGPGPDWHRSSGVASAPPLAQDAGPGSAPALGLRCRHGSWIDPGGSELPPAPMLTMSSAWERHPLAGEGGRIGGDLGAAVDHQRNVGAGTAHVEQEEIGLAGEARRMAAAGPESTAPAARRTEFAVPVATPPWDWMIRTEPAKPCSPAGSRAGVR